MAAQGSVQPLQDQGSFTLVVVVGMAILMLFLALEILAVLMAETVMYYLLTQLPTQVVEAGVVDIEVMLAHPDYRVLTAALA
jgi:hypothetical protein